MVRFLLWLLVSVVGSVIYAAWWGDTIKGEPMLLLVWLVVFPICVAGGFVALGGTRHR